MQIPQMNWATNALTVSHGVPPPYLPAHMHDMSTELRQVALAPASASASLSLSSQPLTADITSAAFDWSRAPSTRAQFFAERLTDVRPVCLRGSRNDAENCLLDLPPDTDVVVSASRLMLAGCETSLPAPVQTTLSRQRRDSRALEQAFSEVFAAESQGKFSVASIEERLTQQLGQMSPRTQRRLRHTDTYIEVPRLSFVRVLGSEQEARRHHVTGSLPETRAQRPIGAPEIRDAMLGAYIRMPVSGRVHSLFISLALPSTVQPLRQDTLKHAAQHVSQLFGEVPEAYVTTRMQMRAVGPGDDIVRTLAELLHDGHQRYGEFARGDTREALAPESHGHVRQSPCQSDLSRRATPTPSPVQPTSGIEAQPQASSAVVREPSLARVRRERRPSLADLEHALAELVRLDRQYSSMSRARYG